MTIEEVLDDMKKPLARDRRMALVFEVYDLEHSKRGSVSAARILQMVRAAK
ncbi:hypothetical protein [Dongia sp.]|uniref:hypothetical protein n=1 Tax=Dongia sp. TaxID=1977262 RepID=UPI0035B45E68